MDTIIISDLEVYYQVGTTEAERSHPQRLLVCVEMSHEFQKAAAEDDLKKTIDYDAVCRRLCRYGEGRQWRLIETLAVEVAEMILKEFRPASVLVEIRKFVIPQARYVGVRVKRPG